jgi:glycosyltransferase involved in cell wall biosynthesis
VKRSDPNNRKLRVLAIATHPVQYAAPQFCQMGVRSDLDFQVAYCSLRGATSSFDADFATTVEWDIPLLDGYKWISVPNHGSGAESFFGLRNPGLWSLVRRGRFDAILCYVGYVRCSFWTAYLAAKLSNTAFLFGTDATNLDPRDGRSWKMSVKRFAWPTLFRLADQVIVPSSGTHDLMRMVGIPEDRITLTPYTVDNDWWLAQSCAVERESVRARWGASSEDIVILFCGKLQGWKRPDDLIRALAKCRLKHVRLIVAGDGPMRTELEATASSLKVANRVRFLGFVNQSELPAIYRSADLMVLPSEYEPFAVVVNEAMCCGCPVAVSDRVGAARDLVLPVHPQFVFPCGNIEALAAILAAAAGDRDLLSELSHRAAAHMQTWSFKQNVPATVDAIRRAVSRRQ